MNYYSHHIGDFNNETRHLTRVERSLYRDAIDLYHDTESALTRDFEKLSRRLLAHDKAEKEALSAVLSEFFILKDDGYHHAKCDEVIAKYRVNTSSKAKAGIASAASRKQKLTPVEHVLNKCLTNQEPITINQEPVKEKIETRGSRLSSDWVAETEHIEFCKTERPDLDPISMQDKFRDYWTGVPGKSGLKSNWLGTWKNFIRSERKQQPRASPIYQNQAEKAKTFLDQLTGKTGNDNIIDIN